MRLLSVLVTLATASAVLSSPPGYKRTFRDLSGATQAPDYLTYKLVKGLDDCLQFCSSVRGCYFVNIYHDVNGKDGSTDFTCSLYTRCHDASDATNTGGQKQPDGTTNYIKDSDGWCKK